MSDTRLRDIEREHVEDPSLGTLRRLADERKRCGEEMLPVAWDGADFFTRTWPVASWTWLFSSLASGYLPSWNAQSRAWELRHTRTSWNFYARSRAGYGLALPISWITLHSVTVRVGNDEQRIDLTPEGPVAPRSPASSPPLPEA